MRSVGPVRRWLASTGLVLSVLVGVLAMHGLGVDHHVHPEAATSVMNSASMSVVDHATTSPASQQGVDIVTTDHDPDEQHGGHAMATMCLATLIGAIAIAHLMSPAHGGTSLAAAVRADWALRATRRVWRRMSLDPVQLQVLRT